MKLQITRQLQPCIKRPPNRNRYTFAFSQGLVMFSFSPHLSAFALATRSGTEEADAQVIAIASVVDVAVTVGVDVSKVSHARRVR